MKAKSYLIIFGIFLLIINICGIAWIQHTISSNKNVVKVRSACFYPDDYNPDRIKVTFDRKLASDSEIGNTAAALFEVEPSLSGSWQWESGSTASFCLDMPLGPGRKVSLSAVENFVELTSYELDCDDGLSLETVPLCYEYARVMTSDNHNVMVEVSFNQPVSPDDFMKHVRFYDAGVLEDKIIRNVKAVTHEAGSEIVVQVARSDSDRLLMVIDKELKGDKADLPLGNEVKEILEIDCRFMYLDQYVYGGDFGESVRVDLTFSQKLAEELPELNISPKVEGLTVSRWRDELVLRGKFEPATRYAIKIPAVLSSENEVTLGKEVEVLVDIPDAEPKVEFVYSGGILSPRGTKTIEAKAVNISNLELRSWRVYENNLVSFLHGGRVGGTAREVNSRDIELDLSRNKAEKLALELNTLIGAGPGIYSLSIRNKECFWNRDDSLVVISDIAITTKQSKDEVVVWVTSLADGKCIEGAVVKGISYQNQKLAEGKTNKDGIARLKYVTGGDKGAIWLVTAQLGKDMNYVKPGLNQWVVDGVDQSGRPWPENYEVMLYPERGVYRPGEKIYITGVIRDKTGGVPPVMPYELKVYRPDGKEVESVIVKPGEGSHGVFQNVFQTMVYYQTGLYTVSVCLPGSERELGSTSVSLEMFTPLRMKVQASSSHMRYGPEENPKLDISARYLWDQPASELEAAINNDYVQRCFVAEDYKDYSFGVKRTAEEVKAKTVKQNLNEEGKLEVELEVPESLKKGYYRLYSTVTVTEPGARSVSSSSSAIVDLLDHHIGVRNMAGRIAVPGESFNIEWVSLDGQGKPLAVDVLSYELLSIEYNTTLKIVNGEYVWDSKEKITKVLEAELQSIDNHAGEFALKCDNSGYYRLVLEDAESGSKTEVDFYCSEYGDKHSLAMNEPEKVEVVTDKSVYKPGDTVKVLLRSPVEGQVLVTQETDRVLSYYLAEVRDNAAELEVTVDKSARGSVYFAATVIRKVDPEQTDWLPHRGYGMARVKIDHSSNKLPLEIVCEGRQKPGSKTTVTVDSGLPTDPNHPAMVHLWAVDEGVLLASNYKNPDPYKFFLQARKPGVSSSDLFNRLLPDYKRAESMVRIGAGGESEFGRLRRSSPTATKSRESAVIWNDVLPTDKTGKLQVELVMPEMTGQMRLMATAFDADRYGSCDGSVVLAKELSIETSCPKFVAPGDRFMVPVRIFNNKTEAVSVWLGAKLSGAVGSEESGVREFSIEPNKSILYMMNVCAVESGEGKIELTAGTNGGQGISDNVVLNMTVRPVSALCTEVKTEAFDAGSEIRISPSETYIADTEYMKLKIFSKPSIQMAPTLEKLVGYPYGCVEQTASRVFGLLFSREIIEAGRNEDIETLVEAGLARLWSMQTPNGGLSYWPGGTSDYPWGTAYVGWCLTEAKKVGYAVDDRFVESLMDYLEKELVNTGSYNNEVDINTRALICRVLASNSRGQTGWINSLYERKDRLDMGGKAHLAIALHNLGRDEEALQLLPEEAMEVSIETTSSGRLTSKLYQQALLLMVLMEIVPENMKAAQLAEEVSNTILDGRIYSTLENSAAVMALAKYQIQNQGEEAVYSGVVKVGDGRELAFSNEAPLVEEFKDFGQPITVSSSGTGKIYIVRVSEGQAKSEFCEPYDKRISVKRKWLDRDGKEIDPAGLKVGDLVKVQIELAKTEGSYGEIDNIAIVDALPAGVEVENPRLAQSAEIYGYESNTENADFQDDRVIIFCGLDDASRVFNYSLRVISAGEFEIPPIQASSMYNSSIASLGMPGRMKAEP